MKTARARLLRDFAFVEFLPRRAPQFGILDPVECEQRAFQPPNSRKAAAIPFCRGCDASCRIISEAVTVPVLIDAAMRRISASGRGSTRH